MMKYDEGMQTTARSPFRPSFGTSPPVLAGRDAIAAEIGDALDAGPGAAGRAVLFTGNRGIGKTVMLNEVEALARERGWVVVAETATVGLVDRLTTEALPELATQLRQGPAEGRRVSGVLLPASLGGLDFDLPVRPGPGGLRSQINALTDVLEPHGTGVLLTLDEVHARRSRDEVAQVCAIVQHAFREDRPVAFAAAGLPAAVQDLLTADVSTFLRRARRFVLQPLTPVAAEEALRRPILDSGRSIDDTVLHVAAAATYGYPFLVQLVGDLAWRQAPTEPAVTMTQVVTAIRAARREIGTLVHEPALNDLSDTDRAFVRAMAVDETDSPIAAIEERLGRDHGYVSRYRSRLIVAGVIEPTRRGYVDFTIPYMRDYVRENADRL
jgi:hypothetical protein